MTIKRRYAPDTNFFLQFKGAEELPWADLTGEAVDEVELVVLIAVASELDHHKGGGNGRRARRARKIQSEVVRPLLQGAAPEGEIVVRKANPRVSYRLAPVLSAENQRHEMLDTGKADCRIVAEAMACSKELYGGELALLSHDTGPISYARAVGLKCRLLPDEWQLKPETDEADKEIRGLRERIKVLESFQPRITLELADEGQPLEKTAPITVTSYPPISMEFLDNAVQAVALRYPERQMEMSAGVITVHPRQAERYNARRKEWFAAIRRYLEACPTSWNKAHVPHEVHLTLKNLGTVSADHLVVEVFARGDVRLVEPELWEEQPWGPRGGFPQPPPLPTHHRIVLFEDGPGGLYGDEPTEEFDEPEVLPRLIGQPGRCFTWWWDKPQLYSTRVEGECGEFRHGIGQEVLSLLLRAAPGTENASNGSLEVRCSARNLPEVQAQTWRVEIDFLTGDTEVELAKILKHELGVDL